MGFFDGLTFNPQGFGGQGGGLLDLLKRASEGYQQYQPQPQNMDAPPIAVGDYMMPRHGPASLYEPQTKTADAVMPQNAQPTQGQMPIAQPEQPNRFMTGLQGFIGNLHNGPIGALAGGIGALATGQRTDPGGIAQQQANLTQQALVRKGFDPDLAQVVSRNPEMLKAVMPHLMGIGGQTDDIKEYQFAKREQPDLTFAKFMQQKKAVSGEYSLTPQYGTDKDGNTVLLQTGKSGEAIQTKLPPGVKISSGVEKIDLGTQWGIIDKRTGQMVGTQAKDLRGAEREKEVGTAQGQAQSKIPAALIDAESASKKIDELLSVPGGIDTIVGPLDQFRPSWTMGDAGRNALARLEQLQGGAFLQAFNTLKGGGAITEAEGRKAEQAIARMQRSQGEADFKIALQDFRDAINDGVKKLRASAGPEGKYPDAIVNAKPSAPTRIRLNADGTVAQ